MLEPRFRANVVPPNLPRLGLKDGTVSNYKENEPKCTAFYELESPEVLTSEAWGKASGMGASVEAALSVSYAGSSPNDSAANDPTPPVTPKPEFAGRDF